MGHLVGKELYRELGKKVDGLTVRSPWNTTLYEILKALYSAEEAEIIVRMPYGLVRLDKIARAVGRDEAELQKVLEGLARKGLVIDVCIRDRFFYMVSPMIIGIYEFTMMRTDEEYDPAKMAKLFHEYLENSDLFFAANFGRGQKVSPLRAMPWEETVSHTEHIEILDYEKARDIIEGNDLFAIGLCSCRHKKSHSEEGACDVPLEKCSTMGKSAEYMIRNGLADEVSKSRMLENLDESRELGLVINADNVQKGCDFMCHCCGCCCLCLLGISQYGYPNFIVSSSFIARPDDSFCIGCGACARACHISVIEMRQNDETGAVRKNDPVVDESMCIGCGVCALKCRNEAMKLVERKQRVIHPENVFERVILQCLERGTLQNQMFPEPENVTHRFMRSFVGGILRLPPVKTALMSDTLRSRFIGAVAKGAKHV
jgi:NAD-dependent dihydropyrimidine dehydrogenase PreA subunit